jgi:hypothetical protein
MALAPAIIINLPGPPSVYLDSVDTIALLRAQPSSAIANGANIVVDGGLAVGDGGGGVYTWDDLSVLTDNGSTIIKPTDVAPLAAGRWRIIGVALDDGASGTLWTTVAGFITYLRSSVGAAIVGFSHANTYSNGSVGKALNRIIYIENAPYNAKGDGIVDDTAAWLSALASGASAIVTRPGANYKVAGLTGVHPNLKFIGSEGIWKMTCTASASSIGLTLLAGCDFMQVRNLHIYSSGNGTDGLATIGLRSDSAVALRLDNCRAYGFSSRGIQIRQCVHAYIDRPLINCDAGTPGYGISLEKIGATPCTTVIINQAYMFGGTRAISGESVVNLTLIDPIFELAGDTNANAALRNGALHLETCTGFISGEYFEGNNCNRVYRDSNITTVAPGFGSASTGVVANVDSYTGVALNARGRSRLASRSLTITEIIADTTSENAIKVTGSVGFGTFPTAGYDQHYKGGEYRVRYENNVGNITDFICGGGGVLGAGEFGFVTGGANAITWQRVSGTNGVKVVIDGTSSSISLNGTKVIGTRGAALPADATDLATAITLVNAIKARMVAHGLVA